MTEKNREIVCQVLKAADGKIEGGIRMQKVFFLLGQLGMESDLQFSYYHYGPFSEKLATAIKRAHYVDEAVKEETVNRNGYQYNVYSLEKEIEEPQEIAGLAYDTARNYITKMKEVRSVVLELAATIVWLQKRESSKDTWKEELKVRKGNKATDSNISHACSLLSELGLPA